MRRAICKNKDPTLTLEVIHAPRKKIKKQNTGNKKLRVIQSLNYLFSFFEIYLHTYKVFCVKNSFAYIFFVINKLKKKNGVLSDEFLKLTSFPVLFEHISTCNQTAAFISKIQSIAKLYLKILITLIVFQILSRGEKSGVFQKNYADVVSKSCMLLVLE